jgi:hypothetical protein
LKEWHFADSCGTIGSFGWIATDAFVRRGPADSRLKQGDAPEGEAKMTSLSRAPRGEGTKVQWVDDDSSGSVEAG